MTAPGFEEEKHKVIQFCSEIGRNPLYTQGAGGNVSWKEQDTLWIKASGTWLANANTENIFLPVELSTLQSELKNQNFNVTPKLKIESNLRPSIETILHALMPHKVVVHLHAIEILAHLVRSDCLESIKQLIDSHTCWSLVDYHKPGADLAEAVSQALLEEPNLDVIFLKSHGVVIGGDNIGDVKEKLIRLSLLFKTNDQFDSRIFSPHPKTLNNDYIAVDDPEIQKLALNKDLFNLFSENWALYPDHIVFLGAHPFVYTSVEECKKEIESLEVHPQIVFIRECGVYTNQTLSKAMLEQLRCYLNVIERQQPGVILSNLSLPQISELLNWDSEKYRMSLSK
jgi:rhamnose utilization protein RhaD (predicted bifunctional aldolase and dehydrogenase)